MAPSAPGISPCLVSSSNTPVAVELSCVSLFLSTISVLSRSNQVLFLLQARGAFVGAISSTSNTYALTPEVRYALGFQQDLQPSPYIKVPEEVKVYTKGIKPLEVPEKLSVSEAAALFEVWMKNKTLHTSKSIFEFLGMCTSHV